MVLAFGFNYHNAPGEAEVELAQMNQVGVIDVIMTEDSDVFVFGAKAVLHWYILLSARTMVDAVLDDFLVMWQVRLQSKLLQPTVAGASRHPTLVNKIPADFLSVEVLKYYALPETSWSIGWTPCDATVWEPPLPDISHIMAFCDSFFHWDSDVQLSHFRKQIWPGIIVQSLYQKCSVSLPSYTVQIQTHILDDQAMPDDRPTSTSQDHKMNIKVPAIVLYEAFPLMVQIFHEKNPKVIRPEVRRHPNVLLNATKPRNNHADDGTPIAGNGNVPQSSISKEIIDLTIDEYDNDTSYYCNTIANDDMLIEISDSEDLDRHDGLEVDEVYNATT
ncbi:hypothetical protein ARMGADRAFT_1033065 [Armillaria gallica]|uniref:XPG-I domain-containing protein n=1 Tax=Armillaria gallica TaxID=47427 RepID=A0A2H3DF63_ARMGA|nr:hypothetical protein ARMGADRAFT_1033065 [Armillaria gallica]